MSVVITAGVDVETHAGRQCAFYSPLKTNVSPAAEQLSQTKTFYSCFSTAHAKPGLIWFSSKVAGNAIGDKQIK